MDAPANYTAFETHSTGLKIKGDGNILPPCVSDPSTTWGECPTCKCVPKRSSFEITRVAVSLTKPWRVCVGTGRQLLGTSTVLRHVSSITLKILMKKTLFSTGHQCKWRSVLSVLFAFPCDARLADYASLFVSSRHYKAASNRYETYFKEGGHCQQHSFDAIAKCLDDGTGRLISQSRKGECCMATVLLLSSII